MTICFGSRVLSHQLFMDSGHRFPLLRCMGSGPQGQQKEWNACTRLGLERKDGGWEQSIFPSPSKPPLVPVKLSCPFLVGKLRPVLVYRFGSFLCHFQGTDVLGDGFSAQPDMVQPSCQLSGLQHQSQDPKKFHFRCSCHVLERAYLFLLNHDSLMSRIPVQRLDFWSRGQFPGIRLILYQKMGVFELLPKQFNFLSVVSKGNQS